MRVKSAASGAALALWAAIAPVRGETVHVVQPGERVPRLEALYGVPAERIRAANGLDSDALVPGARIVIPSGPGTAAPEARRAEPAAPRPTATPAPAVPAPRAGGGGDLGASYRRAVEQPASRGVRYNGRWTPPGESAAWAMDCSNTARWLVRTVRGIEMPRTASGQYEWLRSKRRLWRSRPDAGALRKRLRPGDLLFWEHTYRPARKPPVTHVMVYLGADASGQMWMAGSQSSRGPGVYRFDPGSRMGGYPFFLFFRREGRFVAYGRP